MLAQTKALVAVVVVTTLEAVAAEFPLTVVQMNAQEAALKPGRSSSFIYLNRPAAIRREPKSASTRPLYGVMERGFAFRLDESNGTGTGYDRLLIDFNGNGDLGDDPAEGSAAKRRSRRADATRAAFGPINRPRNESRGRGEADSSLI
jgi:hypothetical protein